MRKFAGALAATMMFAGIAVATDDPMAVAYGNTVTITNAAGEVSTMLIDADNTYTVTTAAGEVHKGTWAIADGQTCFTQTEPAPPAEYKPACSATETRAVGDTWTSGEGDAMVTITIVAGR